MAVMFEEFCKKNRGSCWFFQIRSSAGERRKPITLKKHSANNRKGKKELKELVAEDGDSLKASVREVLQRVSRVV